MDEIVLQERKTFDEVLISTVRTFRNGCNYRLLKEIDDKYYIEYGCYGVHINLLTGDDYLFYKWFSSAETPYRLLTGVASPKTILHLLKQKPCAICGGAKFRIKPI